MKLSVYARMISIPADTSWIEVDSSFGGVAVYKREALQDVHYIGRDETGVDVCEHVPLHKQIKENGYKIFINPSLINTRLTEHSLRGIISKHNVIIRTLFRIFKKFVKRPERVFSSLYP